MNLFVSPNWKPPSPLEGWVDCFGDMQVYCNGFIVPVEGSANYALGNMSTFGYDLPFAFACAISTGTTD